MVVISGGMNTTGLYLARAQRVCYPKDRNQERTQDNESDGDFPDFQSARSLKPAQQHRDCVSIF